MDDSSKRGGIVWTAFFWGFAFVVLFLVGLIALLMGPR